MDQAAMKDVARRFLMALGKGDFQSIAPLVTDDFVFEPMNRAGDPSHYDRNTFFVALPQLLKQLFSNGLRFTIVTAIAEGDDVALQTESEALATNGRHYANRYIQYFRFRGDRIASVREYFDTRLAAELLAPANQSRA